MRDKALLGLMVLLAGMGALVNFTSAILSFLADFMMMGAAVACAILVYRHQQERMVKLERENDELRLQMSQRVRAALTPSLDGADEAVLRGRSR